MIGSNSTISVYKITHGTNTSTYPATANYSGIDAYIESRSPDIMQVIGEQRNIEVFYMHIDPLDLDVGDKIVDDKGRVYYVDGLERHDGNIDTDDIMTVIIHSKQ